MTRPSASRLGLIALGVGAALISLSPICVRLSETGPISTAVYRLGLALPVLALWLALEQRTTAAKPTPRPKHAAPWLVLAGLFFAGDLASWHWSVMLTSVANSTLFANTAPIWVTIAAALFLNERIRLGFAIGLAVALSGAALLMGLSVSESQDHLAGDLLGLLTGVFYACYLITLKRLRGRYSTATVMVWSALPALLPLGLLAAASGERFFPVTLAGWGVLLLLALVVHAGGQSLIGYAFAHLPASFSAVALLLQPLLAALWGWLIVHESLGPLQAAGGMIVLIGIALAHRYSVIPKVAV